MVLIPLAAAAGVAGTALMAGAQGQSDVAAVTGASLHQPLPKPPARPTNRPDQRDVVKDVAGKFKGTHDIAGAAEALINAAGSQFTYNYGDVTNPAQRDFASIRNLDDFYAQRLMICYEFVHYVAYLSSNQTMAGQNPKVGAAPSSVYFPRKYDVWDGTTDIPRGKIVVFRAYAFNNTSGYYHVGVSLGNGKIAHNSSSGNMQISNLSDVNSIGYSEIRISDYDWRASGDRNPGDPVPEVVPEEQPTIEEKIGQLPKMQQARDAAPAGIRVADNSTCCGDPLGELMSAPALAVTPAYQLFVTGSPIDVPVGGAAGGKNDHREFAASRSLQSTVALLSWLLQGAVATLEARRQPPRLGIAVVATGNSTGEAFVLQGQGDRASGGRVFASDGLVLEPTTQTVAMPRPITGTVVAPLSGFCAEFQKQPPPPGTVYRVAAAPQQQRLKPMRVIMRAATDLAAAGKLHPDSSPEGYVNFVKQYAVWTRLERWNRDQFAENFIARSKKNAAAVRQPWSTAVEQQVRALLPGRWADIQSVLQAADAVRR